VRQAFIVMNRRKGYVGGSDIELELESNRSSQYFKSSADML